MPSVSEFSQQCAALGLDHIEVINGERDPEVTLEDITSGKISQITFGTYEYYESQLAQTDIVFFTEDEELNTITFIGNAVVITNSAGPRDSWSYKTKEINIPIDGGVRTFNAAIKDEFIANGVMGIMADSIDNVDEHGNYLENSLFGKIEDKIAVLKGNAATIEGVKIPWLYNLMAFRDSTYTTGLSGITISSNKNEVNNTSLSRKVKCIYCEPKVLTTNAYQYCWKTLSNANQAEEAPFTYSKLLGSIGKYILRTGKANTQSSYNGYGFLGYYGSYQDHDYIYHITYGGYRGSDTITGSYHGIDTMPENYTEFKTQPFLYGSVFWINEIGTIGNTYYLGGYIVLIGLDKTGKIITPKVPYRALSALDLDNGSVTAGVIDIEVTDHDLELYLNQPNGIEYVPDFSPFSPLKGKSIIPLYVPMTADEYSYALNTNYIIAPESYLPDNNSEEVEP